MKWMIILTVGLAATPVQAGVSSKVVKEAIEWMSRKFGKEVAEEGVERLSTRVTRLAAKHGDDLVSQAFRKVGPRAGKIATEAGGQADVALRLLARHGDDALAVASKASARQLVGQFGDDAATALVRHGSVGESVVGQFAEQGAKAMAQVTAQNGRRLAMLAQDGALSPPLLDVVAKYGDRACQFIWANKGSLLVGATLATFVANPEPYLDGTVHLTEVVAERVIAPVLSEVAAPLAELPMAVAVEAARGVNWTVLGCLSLALGTIMAAGPYVLRHVKTGGWKAMRAVWNRWWRSGRAS